MVIKTRSTQKQNKKNYILNQNVEEKEAVSTEWE